jgi:hypothetical protein
MVEELSSKRFRELAVECQEEAKRALSPEVGQGYEHIARQWLKLAEEHELHSHGSTKGIADMEEDELLSFR